MSHNSPTGNSRETSCLDVGFPIAVSAICLLGAFIYANSLHGPFVFDDIPNIQKNRGLRMRQFDVESLRRAAFVGPSSARPVANISFALNHYFGSDQVIGYRAVNIAVHLINAILVYALARITLGLAGYVVCPGEAARAASKHRWEALAAALLFVAHPTATQSVTYLVQRMNSLAVMFYLLSLLLWVTGRCSGVRWRRWTLWVAAAASWLLALGSKQISVTLPLVVWLYESYFFRDLGRAWLRRSLVAAAAALALCVLISLVYTGFDPWGRIGGAYALRDFTLAERLMTQPRVIFLYIGLLLFPHPWRLNLLHHIPTSASLVDPVTTAVCLAALGGLLAVFVRFAAKHRLISFCGLWFFVHLMIESSVLPLEMAFEHRLYLPMVGAVLAAAHVLFHRLLPLRQAWAVAAACLVAVALAAGASVRNRAWSDSYSIWHDVLAKNHRSHRAQMNLGIAHLHEGRLDEAIRRYRQALKIDDGAARCWFNLGYALGQRGERGLEIECYRKALALAPAYAMAHNNLGYALYAGSGDRTAEAIEHFKIAIRHQNHLAEAHLNLGRALQSQGHNEAAAACYERTLSIDPGLAVAYYNLGILAESLGRPDRAVGHYRDALQVDADLVDAHNNLGNLLVSGGAFDEAIGHFRLALGLNPDQVAARINWGRALGLQGRFEEALEQMRQAIQIDADNAAAHHGMGSTLLALGRVHEAMDHYRKALRIEPNSADLHYKLGLAMVHSGDGAAALAEFQSALRLRPDWPQPMVEAAWILATAPGQSGSDPAEAVRLAEGALRSTASPDVELLKTLAAAYASAGQFEPAATTARKAIDLAVAAGNEEAAARIREHLMRYGERRTLHE